MVPNHRAGRCNRAAGAFVCRVGKGRSSDQCSVCSARWGGPVLAVHIDGDAWIPSGDEPGIVRPVNRRACDCVGSFPVLRPRSWDLPTRDARLIGFLTPLIHVVWTYHRGF